MTVILTAQANSSISTAKGPCDSVREPMAHCTKASEVSSPLAGFLLG